MDGYAVTQARPAFGASVFFGVELSIDSRTLVILRLARRAPPKSAGRTASTL